MAAPVITLTPDKPSYAPGEAITVTVTASDPDNATERLVLTGQDSQGNAVTAVLDVSRVDPFTITAASWERTGQALTIDNTNRRVTGTVPSV